MRKFETIKLAVPVPHSTELRVQYNVTKEVGKCSFFCNESSFLWICVL